MANETEKNVYVGKEGVQKLWKRVVERDRKKVDKVPDAVPGNIPVFVDGGNISDSSLHVVSAKYDDEGQVLPDYEGNIVTGHAVDEAINDLGVELHYEINNKADKLFELLYGATAPVMPNCGSGVTYQPYVGACVISAATSFMEADQMLNDQICELLTMWVSGLTCTNESQWVEDGANRKIQIYTRLSRGKYSEMTDEDIFIEELESPLEYIDPTNSEFTDTNVLRIACINVGPSGTTPSVESMQNGIYLSNEWDCGLYYGPSDTEAKAKAEAAGYRTANYSTDETSGASAYNYMNNMRLNPPQP